MDGMAKTISDRLHVLGITTLRTVLDIGAHVGVWSQMIKKAFPTCTPVMIEGNEDNDIHNL